MSAAAAEMERLGFSLDQVPAAAALYRPVVVSGSRAYISGALPFDGPGNLTSVGKLGDELDVERGKQAAALCAANLVRILHAEVGLDNVARFLKLGGYVNCTHDFTQTHLVMNGASELIVRLFGDRGEHARSAIGVAQLPLGASVEVDAIVELRAVPDNNDIPDNEPDNHAESDNDAATHSETAS